MFSAITFIFLSPSIFMSENLSSNQYKSFTIIFFSIVSDTFFLYWYISFCIEFIAETSSVSDIFLLLTIETSICPVERNISYASFCALQSTFTSRDSMNL